MKGVHIQFGGMSYLKNKYAVILKKLTSNQKPVPAPGAHKEVFLLFSDFLKSYEESADVF